MMTSGNRALAAVLGTMALLGVAACGGDQSTPEGLGDAVADAANAEDLDALVELVCANDKAGVEDDFDFKKARDELKAPDLEFDVEFLTMQRKGNMATLTFKTSFENMPKQMRDMGMPSSTEMTQKAVQEEGNWVICN